MARKVAAARAAGWPELGGAVWLVEHDGVLAGSLGLTDEGDGVGWVRWFVFAPEVRGFGLGRRLVAELVACGARHGMERLELETFSALTTAARIYRDGRLPRDLRERARRLGPDDHLPALRAQTTMTMWHQCRHPPPSPRRRSGLEVLLVHPGGPVWTARDAGAWSIPKGEYGDGWRIRSQQRGASSRRSSASRHPTETRSTSARSARSRASVSTPGPSTGTSTPSAIASNTLEIEWPPRSGRQLEIPEVDRAEWFSLADARERIIAAQVALLDRLDGLDEAAGALVGRD